MNALRLQAQRAVSMGSRRGLATIAAPKKPFVPASFQKENNFTKNFLSDPSTYPIIVIVSCAVTFMTGMGINALTNYKDLRMSSKTKHEILQNWGEEKQKLVTASIAQNPTIMHSDHWKQIRQGQGLGMNHQEFVEGCEGSYNDRHED